MTNTTTKTLAEQRVHDKLDAAQSDESVYVETFLDWFKGITPRAPRAN